LPFNSREGCQTFPRKYSSSESAIIRPPNLSAACPYFPKHVSGRYGQDYHLDCTHSIRYVQRTRVPVPLSRDHASRNIRLTAVFKAIPRISDEFNALSDVGWYGSVYLLTCCAFQLLFGKLYAFFSVKHVLLSSIIIFEAASALCGAAPSSAAFIAGRAFAGVGSAGIFAGTVSLSAMALYRPQPVKSY
jgi:hypothetical protein